MTCWQPKLYNVILHNDDVKRREYVVNTLLRVIDNFILEEAIYCMRVITP